MDVDEFLSTVSTAVTRTHEHGPLPSAVRHTQEAKRGRTCRWSCDRQDAPPSVGRLRCGVGCALPRPRFLPSAWTTMELARAVIRAVIHRLGVGVGVAAVVVAVRLEPQPQPQRSPPFHSRSSGEQELVVPQRRRWAQLGCPPLRRRAGGHGGLPWLQPRGQFLRLAIPLRGRRGAPSPQAPRHTGRRDDARRQPDAAHGLPAPLVLLLLCSRRGHCRLALRVVGRFAHAGRPRAWSRARRP